MTKWDQTCSLADNRPFTFSLTAGYNLRRGIWVLGSTSEDVSIFYTTIEYDTYQA